MDSPYILDETDDYGVVFKPPKTHCVSVKNFTRKRGDNFINETLDKWCAENSASFFDLVHRLDYETNGLVLFAKNEKSFHYFKTAQNNGEFIKEYSAICESLHSEKKKIPTIIESYFRPYGKGRKLVRPVIEDGKKHKEIAKDKGGFYRTEIINIEDNIFTVRIKRGFRHQIRCHLCWIGFPIRGDPLYSCLSNEQEVSAENVLALRSHALFFPDPKSGKRREYRINPLPFTWQ